MAGSVTWLMLTRSVGRPIFSRDCLTRSMLARAASLSSGKGAPEFWITRVKPGRILFEIDGVPLTLAREALDLAAAKLPIKTRFVERIAE